VRPGDRRHADYAIAWYRRRDDGATVVTGIAELFRARAHAFAMQHLLEAGATDHH
jgi:hypothetical protein